MQGVCNGLVTGPALVAALQSDIERLALMETLQHCDIAMKQEFADRFPDDILPTEQLPDDVLFRVQPKDPNKIIQ